MSSPGSRGRGAITVGTTPAVMLKGVGRLEEVELALAPPGAGEVLIRVTAVGLCGSDAHWVREGGIGDSTLERGLVLGHELAGVIESGPRAGERVAVDPAVPCLECEPCRGRRFNLCLNLRFAGHGANHGGLRRHLVWPERSMVSLPPGLSDEEGALLEPLGVALHAIDLAGDTARPPVAVIGCGPIGLLVVAALGARGVDTVLAADPLDHRLRAALEMGAEEARPAAAEGKMNVVFDCAGSPSAIQRALAMVRPGGVVVAVGIPDGDVFSFPAALARRKEATIVSCRRMLPGDLGRAAELVASRAVDPGRLVTHRFPLARAGEAFGVLLDRSGIKVLVEP